MGALLVSGLLYGYNWVVMKTALRFAEPAVFSALRVFLAAVVLFILAAALRRPLRPYNPALLAVVGVFGMSSASLLSMWALSMGGAGKTSVLVYTMPLWLLLMSWLILGERIRGLEWVAVGVVLVGLLFVLSPWQGAGTPLSSILGVVSGVFSAVSAVGAKILCRDQKVDLLSLTAWQNLFGAIPLVIVAIVTADSGPTWSGTFVAALGYNIVLASGVAFFLWFYSLRFLPAGTAGLGRLIGPVIGVVASWVQLGERPDDYELAGMALILGGLAFLAAWQARSERRAARAGPLAAIIAPDASRVDTGIM
jgi:drug/metabolite transporter (DMT)-like permease